MAASTDPKQVSPKVRAGALVGLLLSLLGAIIATFVSFATGLTPETFQELGFGIWAIPAATLLATGAQTLAAWWATDPLRAQQHLTEQRAAQEFQTEVDSRFNNQG